MDSVATTGAEEKTITKRRLVCTSILLTGLLCGCSGGGGETPYTSPGIDTGSASSNYQSTVPEPQIGAAVSAPLDDSFDAARFLHRASFGPSTDDIDTLKRIGYRDWLSMQLALPPTFMLPATRARSEPRWAEHVNSWFKLAVNAPDQLRQRTAFALSQLLVVSDRSELSAQQAALANYYDILIANSFGNFRTLLEEVTLSPVMGDYLSMKGNQKADPANNIRPDENYAREILQLFSIGVTKLQLDGSIVTDSDGLPVPTYDQRTVEGFAQVFTGWHFRDVDNWNYPNDADWFSPMQAYDEYHDKEPKTLLDGLTLPGGQTAEQDLQAALDNIFNHPNTGPFVSQHLISQLVTSNPSPQYIERVATVFNDDGDGTRGNLAAVVTAILLDNEALQGYRNTPASFGKLREPLIRLVAMWRAFGGNPDHPDFEYGWIGEQLAQAPLQSPTVFNFYSPSFSQAGAIRTAALKSPVFQIHNESSIISITSTLLAHSLWHNTGDGNFDPSRAPIDLSPLIALDESPQQQMELLAQLVLNRPASDGLLAQAEMLRDERVYADANNRAAELLFLFASSPEAAIQQ